MLDKDFTTFERQIEILKSRNLQFVDEETAFKNLRRFGYYSIINGYKDPYVEMIGDREQYKDGVTFEQIFSLYTLDRNLRNGVMESMLEVEDNLRTAVAHTIAESFTAEESAYLKKENYRSGSKRGAQFRRDSILAKFNKILLDDSQPVKHYRETYGNVPPWILLKKASFGNLVNFTKLLKGPQTDRVISLFYGIPLQVVASATGLKDLFMDRLFVCLDYRNMAAHGGRIYNYRSNATFRYSTILHAQNGISQADYRVGKGVTGLPALMQALALADNKNPALLLRFTQDYHVKEHLKIYPQDSEYLAKTLTWEETADN